MSFTLSDFCNMEIRRTNGIAEIIVDRVDGIPIRLIGFSTKADKDDFLIAEEGFEYYQQLFIETKKENNL